MTVPAQADYTPEQIEINQERYQNFARLGELTFMIAQWQLEAKRLDQVAIELNEKFEAAKTPAAPLKAVDPENIEVLQ